MGTSGSVQSVGEEKANVIDQDGYDMIRRPRPRKLGQNVLEIFARDAERSGDSITKELSKKKLRGDGCFKEPGDSWSLKE